MKLIGRRSRRVIKLADSFPEGRVRIAGCQKTSQTDEMSCLSVSWSRGALSGSFQCSLILPSGSLIPSRYSLILSRRSLIPSRCFLILSRCFYLFTCALLFFTVVFLHNSVALFSHSPPLISSFLMWSLVSTLLSCA